jgi:hypothetical protein
MNTIETSEQIKLSRRRLIGAMAMSVAAAELAGVGSSFAQSGKTVRVPRLYQLIRQKGRIQDRTFEIEFLDSGVEAFSVTFG